MKIGFNTTEHNYGVSNTQRQQVGFGVKADTRVAIQVALGRCLQTSAEFDRVIDGMRPRRSVLAWVLGKPQISVSQKQVAETITNKHPIISEVIKQLKDRLDNQTLWTPKSNHEDFVWLNSVMKKSNLPEFIDLPRMKARDIKPLKGAPDAKTALREDSSLTYCTKPEGVLNEVILRSVLGGKQKKIRE